ncbi:hypothetical protein SAMN05192543_105438 [Paraburkholderia megapolitana]|uniref:Uncharacterized protein n=2 Tax=Paraburkholderia megapolitana TaxID=420953 RepID=A0A1I3NN38_9BURK|nr:hypothetical protein SAMN05192543_105438 [Paraburkholderia megapolitana]
MGHELLASTEEKSIMRKTISMYWPLAIVVPLATAAVLHVCSEVGSRTSQAPLAANQLTAELARTVSFGLVDDDAGTPLKPMRAVAMPLPASS